MSTSVPSGQAPSRKRVLVLVSIAGTGFRDRAGRPFVMILLGGGLEAEKPLHRDGSTAEHLQVASVCCSPDRR